MGLEVVTFISDLVAANPVGATDPKSAGDNHIRNIKAAILATFAAITGAVTASHTELNLMTGATGVTGTGNTVRSASPTFTGTLTAATVAATTVTGAGSGLTALNASNLASGTVPDARFPATLPAASGVNLTALNATNLASGTVADARLSANVPLLSAASSLFGTGPKNEFVVTPMIGISAAGAGAYFVARDTTNDVEAIFGADNTSGLPIGTITAHPFTLRTNNATRFIVDSSGNFDFKGGTVATNNASASEVGFKGLPQNAQTGAYTTVLADANKHIYRGSGSAVSWTIDSNANVPYPIGTTLTFVNFSGSAAITIAITSDTLFLGGAGTTGSRTLANNGIATALKIGATAWVISGAGLT